MTTVKITKKISVADFCKAENCKVVVFESKKKPGRYYAETSTGEFIGMLKDGMDTTLPAFIISARDLDQESGLISEWRYIDNNTDTRTVSDITLI